MPNLKCPNCGHNYVISDRNIPVSLKRKLYDDHLNLGCHPRITFTISRALIAMYDIQKDFIA